MVAAVLSLTVSSAASPVRRHGDPERQDVMAMMFYDMTQQYQASRTKSAAELRRADAELGMMAATAARRWRRLTSPARAVRRTTRLIKLAF